MATMPTYQTADSIALARQEPATTTRDIAEPQRALGRAESAYAQAIEQSRLLSAVCFLVAAATAVGTAGAASSPIVCMLAVAILSALTSKPIAMHQFRREIERTARAEGRSESESRAIAASMATAWEAKRDAENTLERKVAAVD